MEPTSEPVAPAPESVVSAPTPLEPDVTTVEPDVTSAGPDSSAAEPDDTPEPTVTADTSVEDTSAAEAQRRVVLKKELGQISSTLLYGKTNEVIKHLDALTTDQERRDYLNNNPQAKILIGLAHLRDLTEIKDGDPLLLNIPGSTYTFKGQTLTQVTNIDGDEFTCSVKDADEPVVLSRVEIITMIAREDMASLLANFPVDSPEAKVVQHFLAVDATTELSADQMAELPGIIKELAQNNGVVTTDNILTAIRTYYAPERIPTDATDAQRAEITQENLDRAARANEWKQALEGHTLATRTEILNTMDLVGLTPDKAMTYLADARLRVTELQDVIDNESNDAQKKRYQDQLDSAKAMVVVYDEAVKKMDASTRETFLTNQAAGVIPADLCRDFVRHLEKNEMDALLVMASPEASVNATKEEIAAARRAREKFNSVCKGVGLAAALLALMVALGIAQGSK